MKEIMTVLTYGGLLLLAGVVFMGIIAIGIGKMFDRASDQTGDHLAGMESSIYPTDSSK